jgi:hypothetical protein
MRKKQSYRGYVIDPDPVRRRDGWSARAVFEIHERHSVNFQEVFGDPFVTYPTRKEAEEASLQMGKAVLDTRPEHEPP